MRRPSPPRWGGIARPGRRRWCHRDRSGREGRPTPHREAARRAGEQLRRAGPSATAVDGSVRRRFRSGRLPAQPGRDVVTHIVQDLLVVARIELVRQFRDAAPGRVRVCWPSGSRTWNGRRCSRVCSTCATGSRRCAGSTTARPATNRRHSPDPLPVPGTPARRRRPRDHHAPARRPCRRRKARCAAQPLAPRTAHPRKPCLHPSRTPIARLVAQLIDDRRNDPTPSPDLLTVLLAARDDHTGQPLPQQQIHDEVMTLLLAGTDTTAALLACGRE